MASIREEPLRCEIVTVSADVGEIHRPVNRIERQKLVNALLITEISDPFEPELQVCKQFFDLFLGIFASILIDGGEFVEITIVTHDCVGYVPFCALLDRRGQYLIEKLEINFTPSLQMTWKLFANHDAYFEENPPGNTDIWAKSVIMGASHFERYPRLKINTEVRRQIHPPLFCNF